MKNQFTNTVADEIPVSLQQDAEGESASAHLVLVIDGFKIPIKIIREPMTDSLDAISIRTERILDQRFRMVSGETEKGSGVIEIYMRR